MSKKFGEHGEFVAMGTNICEVCGCEFESGEVLLHKNLREIPKNKRCTGWGICPEHQKLHSEGYLALVEATSDNPSSQTLTQETAIRTGRIIHMKYDVADKMLTPKVSRVHKMVFIDPDAFDMIYQMMPEQ